LWRVPLGKGFSSLSVVAGRFKTMAARKGGEFVVCLSANDGSEIWSRRVGSVFSNRFGDGPRATPTVDGGWVYALGAGGALVALGAGDGEPKWAHDLAAEYGAAVPRWGVSTSPLVHGELLLVNVGGGEDGSVVAFDKHDGQEIWRAESDLAGYSTPLSVNVNGVRQVLFFTASRLIALAPDDGRLLWDLPWKTSYDVNAAMPVFVEPDRVFVSSGYDVGAALLKITAADGGAQATELWRTREMKNQFSSSVLHDGHLYGFDDETLTCLNADTGDRVWRKRGQGHGSLTYADGHLYVLGDQGTLALVEATSEEYRERGTLDVFEGKTWTVPTLSGGRLYVRDESHLVAFDVTKAGGRP
jgi:outer membrane protein assembly factor BamB